MTDTIVHVLPKPAPSAEPLLRVVNVVKHFSAGGNGSVKAVDGVTFDIMAGETVGLVGESGCGKSTLGRLISQLIPVTSGEVILDGVDITKLSGEKMRQQRKQLQMIFQDPYASLDPRMTVGDIIAEPLVNFKMISGKAKDARVQELLRTVGLNPYFNNRYPHEFSGGQRQRIGIARALALNPKVIICDEPVSALDVSIQAQIINLLEDLQREFNLTYLFIAHDLSVVRHISDRVMVMYLGRICEVAPSEDLYVSQDHPYTRALLSSIPVPDPRIESKRRLVELSGEIPSPLNPPSGCLFHTRCPIAQVPGVCADVGPAARAEARRPPRLVPLLRPGAHQDQDRGSPSLTTSDTGGAVSDSESPFRLLYTAEATVTGGRRGHGATSDGRLTVDFSSPTEMGGDGGPGHEPRAALRARLRRVLAERDDRHRSAQGSRRPGFRRHRPCRHRRDRVWTPRPDRRAADHPALDRGSGTGKGARRRDRAALPLLQRRAGQRRGHPHTALNPPERAGDGLNRRVTLPSHGSAAGVRLVASGRGCASPAGSPRHGGRGCPAPRVRAHLGTPRPPRTSIAPISRPPTSQACCFATPAARPCTTSRRRRRSVTS